MADSAKTRIRKFFLDNIGEVVTAAQLQKVAAPVSEWARRVRELRDEESWPIESQHDNINLKSGQYRLVSSPPVKETRFQRGISQKLRAEVLDRNGFTCQMCGKTPGEVDPDTGRMVRLHIGHIVDKKLGGRDELSNLRTLCSTCNQGAKNITLEKPTHIWLLSQVRRAALDDQLKIRDWLNNKFE